MAEQKLVITGIPPYDGEYPIDDSGFTTEEYHYIKTISGVRAGELEEAMQAGDAACMVAFTGITLCRAGVVPALSMIQLPLLWAAKDSCFDVVSICPHCQARNEAHAKLCATCGKRMADDEEEGRPLATATSGGNASEPDAAVETNASLPSSGQSGTATGSDSQPALSGTGSPGLDASLESGQKTSEE